MKYEFSKDEVLSLETARRIYNQATNQNFTIEQYLKIFIASSIYNDVRQALDVKKGIEAAENKQSIERQKGLNAINAILNRCEKVTLQ